MINVAKKRFWLTLKKSTPAEVVFFNETWVQYHVKAFMFFNTLFLFLYTVKDSL